MKTRKQNIEVTVGHFQDGSFGWIGDPAYDEMEIPKRRRVKKQRIEAKKKQGGGL